MSNRSLLKTKKFEGHSVNTKEFVAENLTGLSFLPLPQPVPTSNTNRVNVNILSLCLFHGYELK